MKKLIRHPFHLVTPSPWPLITSISALCLTTAGVMYMHRYFYSGFFLLYGLCLLIASLSLWWRDVIREATFEGMHTIVVQRILRIGFLLFILSEVMFFVSFFWAFFHSSLAPAIQIGGIWPPHGIAAFSPWGVPLLNTYLLLYSGITITIAHYSLLAGNFDSTLSSVFFTILLGVIFTCIQFYEYYTATFTIADGIYGSVFYLATGFHMFSCFNWYYFFMYLFYTFLVWSFYKTTSCWF